ncbi:MAG: flavin reductase family protein [Anaerolineae bacterium]
MDPEVKKKALRLFTYGLYAVTAADAGEVAGMTANWLAQAAFEPPMLMVAFEADSRTLAVVRHSGTFAVNVYESGQRELAGQLGRASVKRPDKLEAIASQPGPLTGAPLLDAALAWVECRVTGELPSGDHVVVVAEVINAGVNRDGQPLTMAEAGFRYFG